MCKAAMFYEHFWENCAQNIDVRQVEGGFWRHSEKDESKMSKKTMFTHKDSTLGRDLNSLDLPINVPKSSGD